MTRSSRPPTLPSVLPYCKCVKLEEYTGGQQSEIHIPFVRLNRCISLVHPLPSVSLVFWMNLAPGWVAPCGIPWPANNTRYVVSSLWYAVIPHPNLHIGWSCAVCEWTCVHASVTLLRQCRALNSEWPSYPPKWYRDSDTVVHAPLYRPGGASPVVPFCSHFSWKLSNVSIEEVSICRPLAVKSWVLPPQRKVLCPIWAAVCKYLGCGWYLAISWGFRWDGS